MTAEIVPFPDRFDRRGIRFEPWVGEDVVARHFGVSGPTVRRWRQLGMPSRRFEGARRYRLSECEAWHEERAS